jgi:hypothetical protein
MNSPAGQSLRTELHATMPSAVEKVEPSVHGVHSRSASAVPPSDMPLPMGQVLHAEHDSGPVDGLKWPAAHGMQMRSEVAVGALDS